MEIEMNTHEWHGGARYVGGKVEKAVGDAVESRDWQVDGVVDQVAGAAENLYGRAQSVAEDAIDAAPHLAAKGRDAVADAADRTAEAARHGTRVVARSLDERPVLWAAAAAAGGYALAWLIHGQRA
jgi:uncharacterized protein YjbJ (UPF0337 family)